MTRLERLREKRRTLARIGLIIAGTLAACSFGWFLISDLAGQRQFAAWTAIALHYGAPAVVAMLLFASLRLGPSARLRLLISSVSLTASLYAVELVLTFFSTSPMSAFSALDGQSHAQLQPVMTRLAESRNKAQFAADLTRRFGHPIDIRSAAEVVDDLNQAGIDVIPIVTPSNNLFISQPDGTITSSIALDGREVIPLASVADRNTLLCNENGDWIRYRSDSRGFNNPDDVWRSRRVDIAALGDSFTHGFCVPGGETFVDLIRQRDHATLNLGMAGNGPLLMLATLKEYLPSFTPKLVLWFYYEGNDLVDLQTERRSALLMNYLRDDFSQPDLARQGDIDRAILAELPRLAAIAADNARRHSRNSLVYGLTAFAKLTSLRRRLLPVIDTDPKAIDAAADFERANVEVFREIMRQAHARVGAWHGHLYFVYLPEWTRYTSYSSWGKAKRGAVLDLVRRLGIPIIDIDPIFRMHGEPLSLFPFGGVGHYTAAGHRLVADEVLRRLEGDEWHQGR